MPIAGQSARGAFGAVILFLASASSPIAEVKEKGRLGPWQVVHALTEDDATCQASTCSGLSKCTKAEGAGLFLSGWVNRGDVTPMLRFARRVPNDFRATLTVGSKDFLFGYGQGNAKNSAISESKRMDTTILRALARHAKSPGAFVSVDSSLGRFDIPLEGFSTAQAFIQSRCGIPATR